jgi:peptidyl-prolyl cis-trans isomerase D
MFDFAQRNKRTMQIVFALVVLPFAFWGVDSYTRSNKSDNAAATVDGEKISQQQFANELRQQQDRLREQLGQSLDPAILDSVEMKRSVLDKLVSQRLMLATAHHAKMIATDDAVANVIGGIEAFRVDGKFDKSRYASVLANQGMSTLGFEARIREDLLWQQVKDTYLQNGYTSLNVVDNIIRLNEQQRTVSIAPVSFQSFLGKTDVSDDEMKKYYNQNLTEFEIREQAKVEYVKFSVDNLMTNINIDEEESRRYYAEHKSEFGTPEERKASHILFATAGGAKKAEVDAAHTQAEKVLEQVRTTPDKFADLARKYSEDPGSASNGGDLGFFGRGMMTKPFEDAAFTLKPGEISGLVQTDFGFHIIKLTDVKPSSIPPYEKVKSEIVARLKMQKASAKYAEMAEQFSNTVYEQSDTLKPAADLTGSKIEQAGWIFNGGETGDIWTAKMLQAVFNDEVIKNKRNTAAIEVAPNTLVAARVTDYKPSAVREFDEVKDAIRAKLKLKQARQLATNQGIEMLSRLKSGDKSNVAWEPAQNITRAKYGSLSAELVKAIFQAPIDKLPQFIGIEDMQRGYVLAKIDAVKDGEVTDAKRPQYIQQLHQLTGDEMLRAYLAAAKQAASISLNLAETSTTQQ